ncbi:MAG: peptide-N-glycosidase F-related protein [Planctomycetota bacterium]|nr:peptide-N-glycosidase F-related protein [Planctomycetota bacterium]
MRCLHLLIVVLGVAAPGFPAAGAVERFSIFDAEAVSHDPDLEEPVERDGLTVMEFGQKIQATVLLPPPPADQREARRIVATVRVEPILTRVGGRVRPGDPWTRIGSASIVQSGEGEGEATEIELMRFITGFGGPGVFEQDVTPLAPLLTGPTTFRLFISTYLDPGWQVTMTLTYSDKGVGFRRPTFAQALFNDPEVTAEENVLRAEIEIPPDLAQPRLRILSTGHATDGADGDEFVPRTHVLTIDGKEIARWRPWAERGGPLRELNPTSGRMTIDGRELWSSDLDRAGWHPGLIVKPLLIPTPELTPGKHMIRLEIEGIRPQTEEEGPYGYWRVSGLVVADEPWPGVEE